MANAEIGKEAEIVGCVGTRKNEVNSTDRRIGDKMSGREHITDGRPCWCNPEIINPNHIGESNKMVAALDKLKEIIERRLSVGDIAEATFVADGDKSSWMMEKKTRVTLLWVLDQIKIIERSSHVPDAKKMVIISPRSANE